MLLNFNYAMLRHFPLYLIVRATVKHVFMVTAAKPRESTLQPQQQRTVAKSTTEVHLQCVVFDSDAALCKVLIRQ
jgi:hypothetical protein